MISLILASQSTYRLQLLSDAGYDVQAWVSGIVEPDPHLFSDPEAAVSHLAQLKARAVRSQGARGLVLGADTVGLVGGKIFGKPQDCDDARRMLSAISGTTHEVLTGWCLLRTRDELCLSGLERTRIVMRVWTDAELERYLDSREWEGKCGAYGLQLPIDPFVTRIEGSAANVIGVPLERIAEVLAEFPGLSAL